MRTSHPRTAQSPFWSPLPALMTPYRTPQGTAGAATEAPREPFLPKTAPADPSTAPRHGNLYRTFPSASQAAPAASRGGKGPVGAPLTCPASPNPKKGKGTRCASCLRSKYPRRGPAPSLPPPPPVTFPAAGPAEEAAGERLRTGGARPRVPAPLVPAPAASPGGQRGSARRELRGRPARQPVGCPGFVWGSPSPVSPPPLPPGSHNLPFYHRRSHQLHRPAPPPAQARTGQPAPPPAGERSGRGPQRRSAGSRCRARGAAGGAAAAGLGQLRGRGSDYNSRRAARSRRDVSRREAALGARVPPGCAPRLRPGARAPAWGKGRPQGRGSSVPSASGRRPLTPVLSALRSRSSRPAADEPSSVPQVSVAAESAGRGGRLFSPSLRRHEGQGAGPVVPALQSSPSVLPLCPAVPRPAPASGAGSCRGAQVGARRGRAGTAPAAHPLLGRRWVWERGAGLGKGGGETTDVEGPARGVWR